MVADPRRQGGNGREVRGGRPKVIVILTALAARISFVCLIRLFSYLTLLFHLSPYFYTYIPTLLRLLKVAVINISSSYAISC